MILLRRLTAHNFKQLRDVDLRFPERGRFLVTGLNEAGKSTLFEAVFFALFGKPLATESGRASMEDLIHYGSEEALVLLELDLAGGRGLSIARRIRRGKPNVWELDLHAAGAGLAGDEADARVEEVRGNREVNARVEAELGFDGEALLNTCFVEQKKLEKLEGMSRSQREQSLMKLLNLDRLVEIGDRLKIRLSDRQDLERLADRAKLAGLRAERPGLEAKAATGEARLARLEAHAALESALDQLAELETGAAELIAARIEARRQAERAERVVALGRALERWRAGREAAERAAEALEAAGEAETALASAKRVRDEELPATLARGQALGRLRRRREWLAGLQDEREELARRIEARDAELKALAQDLEALNDCRRELVEARAQRREAHDAIGRLEQDRRAFDVGDALREWLELQTDGRGGSGVEDILDEARTRRDHLEGRVRLFGAAFVAGLVAWIALAAGVLLVLGPSPLWLLLLGAAALGILGLGIMALPAWRGHRALAVDVARLEGEAAVAEREADRRAARREEAAERIRKLNAVLPADAERGAAALAEIEARLEGRDRSSVDAELQGEREREARSGARSESLVQREEELRARSRGRDGAVLGRERDAWAARVARIDVAIERRRPRIEALAGELGLPEGEDEALEDEIGRLREQFGALRRQAERVEELEAALATSRQRAETAEQAAREAWRSLPEAQVGAEPDPITRAESWEVAGAALERAHEQAGGQRVEQAAADAARKAAELAGAHNGARAALERVLGRLAGAKAIGEAGLRLETSLPELAEVDSDSKAAADAGDRTDATESVVERYGETREGLQAAREALAPEPDWPDLEALKAQQEALRSRLDVLRHEIGRLEQRLGLAGELIDAEEAAEAHRKAERELAVRERAGEIVTHASRNVVRRILPSTLQHMRRLLPALTEERYFDAQLGDDYRIQVYDDRAGAWKMKNIFSGGTRDQLSLALRLAFALATLPEERGAAPSFLFLDEPLGAFDARRARALLGLLTEGEIAESFDQIFLISHLRVEPGIFDYYLRLDDGRVVESNLPGAGVEDGDVEADEASVAVEDGA